MAAAAVPLSRVFATRAGFCAFMAVYMPAMLWLDANGPQTWQYGVDVATWLVLGVALVHASGGERRQLVAVVAIATCFEILFSIVWGMYRYRFGNLPLYVPPGHGLIYLLAVRLGALPAIAQRPRRAATIVTVAVCAWVAGGVLVPSRPDLVGLALLPYLLICLWTSRRANVYVGAFIATATLEIVGTRFGNWRWADAVPGVGLTQGNPPSAIAAGYCILDTVTIAVAAQPWLGRLPLLRARAVQAASAGD